MDLGPLLLLACAAVAPAPAAGHARPKVNIPYIAPDTEREPRGTVVLDGSQGGDGELPFVEVRNAEAYLYKDPQDYHGNSLSRRERELEAEQARSASHFDFLNELVGNFRGRI